MTNFGDRLKEELIIANISVEILSEKIGVPKITVYHWCDNTAQPYLHNIIKLADYFGYSTDYLLGREHTKYENIVFKNNPPFSTQLRKFLKEKRVSKFALSKTLNIGRSRVYEWLNDKTSPQLVNLIKLADYFGTTVDILIGRQ